jgi:diaminohydroxyphosphoribosylaminopyrimidine deaminase/5-amino-6-(5-phosphoribosylamino)uracil reductase
MRDAVALTQGTHPHPNPRVGAIVLSADGEVLSRAAHTGPGSPHAEADALATAGRAAAGGYLIVTLEPCSHHGLTPPCVDTIIASGVASVIVGPVDPDDRVAGTGLAMLRAAGIDVVADVGVDDVIAADPGYFHHRRTGRPLVTLKYAATADGQIAAADGTSQWITGEEARADAHRVRAGSDAVMIGAGTLRADDPLLTVRYAGSADRQPMPVLIAGRRPLPESAALYARRPLIYRPGLGGDEPPGAEVVTAWSADGVDLAMVVKDLGDRGIVDLLVEGGPTLARSLLDAGLVDRLVVYVGARLAGGRGMSPFAGTFRSIDAARPLAIESVTALGPDVKIVYRLEEEA